MQLLKIFVHIYFRRRIFLRRFYLQCYTSIRMTDPIPTPAPENHIQFFMLSAHEMRTYLTATKWILSIIQKGDAGSVTTEQQGLLLKALDSNEHLLTLLNKVLTVLRTNQSIEEEPIVVFDLAEMIQDTVSLFSTEAQGKNISISFSVPGIVLFHGKKEKIGSVFHNLIENAIKYSSPFKTIEVILEKRDTEIHFTVKNSGPSIPASDQSHIFQEFYRASNTEKTVNGFGLGLYAVKQIVEAHNGSVQFSSINNETVFSVTLPFTSSQNSRSTV